ncbi:hypothetical protein [Noviherbaspirillum cavernae]|nr:hypothetical protein [Noviherbaspirillum cavernae]
MKNADTSRHRSAASTHGVSHGGWRFGGSGMRRLAANTNASISNVSQSMR